MNIIVRPEEPADHASIRKVIRLAFGREAEARLVDGLRAGGYSRLALVAQVGQDVTGHILFSRLPIVTNDKVVEALALAPLAVVPSRQRQGIGSHLVREGLRACAENGHRIVVVLGHPGYYPRFGFSAKLAQQLESPFRGDSFMALELVPGAMGGISGRVEYPSPFFEM